MSDLNIAPDGLKFNRKTVKDIDVEGKRILMRVDYNVPTDKNGVITDDNRIRASLPTINYLLDQRARIIICSHFGRPNGKVVETMRLNFVAARLAEILKRPVTALKECIGPEVEKVVFHMNEGDIVMLENLRFHPEEEANDPDFASALARLGEVYVNDAFGASHRAHASITGIADYLPAVSGFLMERELNYIGYLLDKPAHPFVVVMGGAKVSDKIGVVENILDKVEIILIGGGMAANFLKAQGLEVGASAVEEDKLEYTRELLVKAQKKGVRFVLPEDVIAAKKIEVGAASQIVAVTDIPAGWVIADIGPETIKTFIKEINSAKTIFWNGPMGVFEIEAFSKGTTMIAQSLADSQAATVVGGGSTAEVVAQMNLSSKMTHVSTGGGASLELLEGVRLPGVAVLLSKGYNWPGY